MKLKLFMVTRADDMSFEHVYTITITKKEADEYINKRTYIENKNHFQMWCNMRGLTSDPKSNDFNESWAKYYDQCIFPNPPKYVVHKISYNKTGIATLFRIYNGCVPIGCSYDEDIEITAALQCFDIDKDKIDSQDDETKLTDLNHKA